MKRITTILLTSIAVATLSSCTDFLMEEPQSSLTKDQALSQLSTTASMVDGLYGKYRASRIGRDGLVINLGMDESQQGYFQLTSEQSQAGYDRYNVLLSSVTRRLSPVWGTRFPYQVTAADIIQSLSKQEPTPQINELLGTAHFFRGMGMFELSMFFGKVPISDPDKFTEIKRQPLPLVWEYIINDFTKAAELLPVFQGDPKKVTKGAALAMLGKAYMCDPNKKPGERDYKAAQTAFEQLFKLNRYRLVDDYAQLFINDTDTIQWIQNSPESIFELQFSVIWGDGDCNIWQWDTGSRLAAQAFTQSCYFTGWDFLVPTPWAYKMRGEGGVWEADDPRRELSLRYDFTRVALKNAVNKADKLGAVGSMEDVLPWRGKEGENGNVHDEKDPHIRKFEDVRTDEQMGDIKNMFNSGKNHPLIRLADIYLLYAECLHRTGETGLEGDKNHYVQLVRDRAWRSSTKKKPLVATAPPMPSTETVVVATAPESADADAFIRDLMDERVRELAFEGWRRIDLLRTGLYRELVSTHNVWAKIVHGGNLIPAHTTLLPIPQDELLTNPDLSPEDQNPEYE